jgi:hypothetical protein
MVAGGKHTMTSYKNVIPADHWKSLAEGVKDQPESAIKSFIKEHVADIACCEALKASPMFMALPKF